MHIDISDLTIKICRHARSVQNAGSLEVRDIGDHRIPLAEGAEEDARRVGRENTEFLRTPGAPQKEIEAIEKRLNSRVA